MSEREGGETEIGREIKRKYTRTTKTTEGVKKVSVRGRERERERERR